MKSPKLITLLKWIRNARQDNKYLHQLISNQYCKLTNKSLIKRIQFTADYFVIVMLSNQSFCINTDVITQFAVVDEEGHHLYKFFRSICNQDVFHVCILNAFCANACGDDCFAKCHRFYYLHTHSTARLEGANHDVFAVYPGLCISYFIEDIDSLHGALQ